jgi:hypothetical protein
MGCDIHITPERKTENGYEPVTGVAFAEGSAPFDWRSYGMFGFLAGVRNYSAAPSISQPRGLPDDVSLDVADYYDGWAMDAHSASWLSVAELAAFDYDKQMEDRRVTINNNGGCTAEPGGGKKMTFREFLGPQFFEDLSKLQECGADRIVFWFDN